LRKNTIRQAELPSILLPNLELSGMKGLVRMSPKLDYASPLPRTKTYALLSMVCGVCSGPAGVGLAVFSLGKSSPWSMAGESVIAAAGLIALAVPLLGSFIFALIVMNRLPKTRSRQEHIFAIIGSVAPVAWGVAIVALFFWAMSNASF
jgi:hypothetical protein